MKYNKIVILLLCAMSTIWVACDGDTTSAGASALQEGDDIRVKSDTFAIHSALVKSDAISVSPDSFLLGECDTHFGTIKADILTQFASPDGFHYPDFIIHNGDTIHINPTVDSVCLYLYYQNWYGDGLAPLGITVHEMDRATLNYDDRYPSDTALTTFSSMEDSTKISERSHIIIAQEPTDSVYQSDGTYVSCVKIKLTDAFAKKFFAIKDFSSQEAFNQLFKGLYISSDFGGSTVLYIRDISMAVFFHFSYPQANLQDTTINDVRAFYANSEVRQINRYLYPDRDDVLNQLNQQSDSVNYIISPANIYTRLSVRMDSIAQQIEKQLGNEEQYRVYVNRANVTVDVLYDKTDVTRPRDEWDMPASYMLLVQEDKMERFFAKNELPSDTTAILSSLQAETDTLGNVSYYYSYDLSGMITAELRSAEQSEELHFLLVPVTVATASSSATSVTSVRPLQTISATYIRSSNNSQPIDIEMVYSGFNKRQ